MENCFQHIYLYMDDSGKISKTEDYAIFSGIVFKNSEEKSEFRNMYKSIQRDIKCSYCSQMNGTCTRECPEIKAYNIKPKHRRRIINLSKRYLTFGVVIYNKNLYKNIIKEKAAKGRFVEYAQRRIIKNVVENLISKNIVNPNLPIYLHVNIDEMPTKSNGYYSLKEGIVEELKNGILNFDYGTRIKPIVFGELKTDVLYKDSKKDVGIQMADILANTVRHSFVINNNWYSTCQYLMEKCGLNVLLRLPK